MSIKKNQKTRNRGELPQFDKEHLQNTYTGTITLNNGERLNAFPIRSEPQRGSVITTLLQHNNGKCSKVYTI